MAVYSSSSEDDCCAVINKRAKFTYFGLRLVPFLKTAMLYLVLVPEINPPTIVVAILKCLPTLSLCVFVLWFDGFSFTSRHQYSRRVLGGLILSMLGDICLVDEDYFLHGTALFAVAHIMYIFAFGFRPLRPFLCMKLAAAGLIMYWFLYSGLNDIILKVAVFFYIGLIALMNWRALARIRSLQDIKAGVTVSSHKKWTHLVAGLGALSFCLSDSFLAINRFYTPVTNQRWIVMTTYYLAQLGIALSVVRNSSIEQKRRLTKKAPVNVSDSDSDSEFITFDAKPLEGSVETVNASTVHVKAE